jgi:hypothetical protein
VRAAALQLPSTKAFRLVDPICFHVRTLKCRMARSPKRGTGFWAGFARANRY